AQADKISAEVGPGALRAAFFLGHVEAIGLKPDGSMIDPAAPDAAQHLMPQTVTAHRTVSSVTGLSIVTGAPEDDIVAANSGLVRGGPLPAAAYTTGLTVPGTSHHWTLAVADRSGGVAVETKAKIAVQHGVSEPALERANPELYHREPREGEWVLIPVHRAGAPTSARSPKDAGPRGTGSPARPRSPTSRSSSARRSTPSPTAGCSAGALRCSGGGVRRRGRPAGSPCGSRATPRSASRSRGRCTRRTTDRCPTRTAPRTPGSAGVCVSTCGPAGASSSTPARSPALPGRPRSSSVWRRSLSRPGTATRCGTGAPSAGAAEGRSAPRELPVERARPRRALVHERRVGLEQVRARGEHPPRAGRVADPADADDDGVGAQALAQQPDDLDGPRVQRPPGQPPGAVRVGDRRVRRDDTGEAHRGDEVRDGGDVVVVEVGGDL